MRGKITTLVAAVAAAAGAATAARWARGRKEREELDLEVSDSPRAPRRPVAPATSPTPAASPAPVSATTDDLTAIKGLGQVKAAKLVAAGVTSYAQIAAWGEDDVAEMGLVSNTSPGQIRREDWVGQARSLASD